MAEIPHWCCDVHIDHPSVVVPLGNLGGESRLCGTCMSLPGTPASTARTPSTC